MAGFTLTEGIHPAGSSLPWHHHDGPTLCFVLHGAFTETSGGERLTCTARDPQGHARRRAALRRLRPGRRPGPPDRGRPRPGAHPSAATPRSWTSGWRSTAGCRRRSPAGSIRSSGGWTTRPRWRSKGCCWSCSPRCRAAQRARCPTAARPGSATVRDTAARRHRLAPHPRRAGRCGRGPPGDSGSGVPPAFGCTVGEYLRRLRIERAAEQLSRGDAPLAEIALTAGFADQSHFSNVFRRRTGDLRRRPPGGPSRPRVILSRSEGDIASPRPLRCAQATAPHASRIAPAADRSAGRPASESSSGSTLR